MSKKAKKRNRPPAPVRDNPVARPFAQSARTIEALGLLILAALLVFFLSLSWRKWPDPLIDFGRELYLPWRLSQGAVLYRDLEGHYGPLSQYFNGLLFACFGPGLMILVAANLIIFLGIVSLVYLLSRRAWGPAAAFGAAAVFISVFGFSQLTGISNYNYATPYAHETTHGLLVSLSLTLLLTRWVRTPSLPCSLGVGLLFGLCFVLKPEFILAGALVGVAAFVLRWRFESFPNLTSVATVLLGVLLPTFAFTAYFTTFASLSTAFSWATQAWFRFAATTSPTSTVGIQGGFSGTVEAGSHLTEHAVAVLIALSLIGLLVLTGWLIKKVSSISLSIGVTAVAAVGLACLSWFSLNWTEVGRCFLGLLLLYGCYRVLTLIRPRSPAISGSDIPRLLLAVLAASLMARMVLNGRIYHYGFVQAAVAGSILPAILVGELPEWLRLKARERALMCVVIAALVVPGVVKIASSSQSLLRTKTTPVGQGVDRFYAFSEQMEPTGAIVNAAAVALSTTNKSESLLVLPEGIMINYLARIPSTVPYYFFRSTSPQLVSELEAKPPRQVVLISRDLREYGVERYGEQAGGGQEIMLWLTQHYRQVAHIGGSPLNNRQRGAVIFERKSAP